MRKLAIAVPIVAGVAAVAYLVIGLVGSLLNNDKFGKVNVPGEAALELDEGTVAVYYQERTHLSENESLDAPGDLTVRVTLRGEPIELEKERFGSSYSIGDNAGTQIATLDAPESGRYGVVTSGALGHNRPEVTFGEEVPVGTLLVRSGLIILVGLAAGGAFWALDSRRKHSRPVSATPPLAAPSAPETPDPGPQPPGVRAPADPGEELRSLDARHKAGALTDAEHQAARREILDRI